ncbi:MAG: hypothetical protein JWP76_3357 [Dactylosporangium sp.]|jgi:nitroreductase|nr:hypothetical protein [Dactylosporangium sp.]
MIGMNLVEAISTRRSTHALCEPAPEDDAFVSLLEIAATAPDHGMLRPWRWILLRGAARLALGSYLSRGAPPERQHSASAKAKRTPLMAILVFKPSVHHKVFEWEQLAATSSMTYAMMLLLHASGFGSIWRTGSLCTNEELPRFLGLTAEERVLGSLDIGTPLAVPTDVRPTIDIASRVSTMSAPGLSTNELGKPIV